MRRAPTPAGNLAISREAALVERSSSVAKPLSLLRRAAAKVLKGNAPRTQEERDDADGAGSWYPVCACTQSHHRNASSVTALQRASGAKTWAGIMTCGSVWLCATCAQKIEKVRGDEVCRLIETARARGMIVVMMTHTFPHKIADSCKDSMDGLSEALRKMRQRGGYQRFRKSLGFVGLVRSTEVTYGFNGWHPHVHELWVLDPVESSIAITDLGQTNLEELIACKVFPQWEAAARAIFGENRAPTRAHGLDVSLVWSANDYLAKCPDRVARLNEAGKTRWGADAEMTKTTAKKGRRGSRTFWDILPIAAGEGPSFDEQKSAKQFALTVEHARHLVLDYARGTWRKRRMYWTPARTTKDGYVEGLRHRFDIGEELTDEQIADGELPMTGLQSKEELKKRDPVVAAVEFCIFSLAGLGRPYLADLLDRAAGSHSIIDIARGDGWQLERLADHPDGYRRFSAIHSFARGGGRLQ
ncbi:hypothetical protein OVY29_21900 [Sphingopyxis sp. SE2]|uniref:hypothetical protein n=1 Tax=Sphingopyxis sp. SE2 TaxID=1586240 RepID=UPI0028C0AE34|nr:hypothetical protein [Sphingopyxis sp. SE2]MDT7531315.1 hypothetical protein [Sphingopyxis sp. SE2]